jgi:hypothetical protein
MIMRWISDVPSKIVKLVTCWQFPQVDGLQSRRMSARLSTTVGCGQSRCGPEATWLAS